MNDYPQIVTQITENGVALSTVIDAPWVSVTSINGMTGDVIVEPLVIDFLPNRFYKKNTLVLYNGDLYRANADFTTGPTFNSSDWSKIAPNVSSDWADITNKPEYSTLVPETRILANSNLNSVTYLRPGRYYVASYSDAQTISNLPVTGAMLIETLSPFDKTYGDETTNAWLVRIQRAQTTGGRVYYRDIQTMGTAGQYTYGNWVRLAPTSMIPTKTSDLTNDSNFVSDTNYNRIKDTYSALVPDTEIPANADLNDTAYLRVGRYYVRSAANAATISHMPKSATLMLEVLSPIQPDYDVNLPTATWIYRIQRATIVNGEIWYRYAHIDGNAGQFTFTRWFKVATDNELSTKQDSLVSGTNIKTINGNSLLGSGDITVGGGAIYSTTEETKSGEIWEDGREIYQKTYYIQSLPNTDSMTFAELDIDVVDTIIDIFGFTTGNSIPWVAIPSSDPNNHLLGDIRVFAIPNAPEQGKWNVFVRTYQNLSQASAYITIKYVKEVES